MISMKMNFRFAIIASLFILMCNDLFYSHQNPAHLAVEITEFVRSFLEPAALHNMAVNLLTVEHVASLEGGDLAVETCKPVALERS